MVEREVKRILGEVTREINYEFIDTHKFSFDFYFKDQKEQYPSSIVYNKGKIEIEIRPMPLENWPVEIAEKKIKEIINYSFPPTDIETEVKSCDMSRSNKARIHLKGETVTKDMKSIAIWVRRFYGMYKSFYDEPPEEHFYMIFKETSKDKDKLNYGHSFVDGESVITKEGFCANCEKGVATEAVLAKITENVSDKYGYCRKCSEEVAREMSFMKVLS